MAGLRARLGLRAGAFRLRAVLDRGKLRRRGRALRLDGRSRHLGPERAPRPVSGFGLRGLRAAADRRRRAGGGCLRGLLDSGRMAARPRADRVSMEPRGIRAGGDRPTPSARRLDRQLRLGLRGGARLRARGGRAAREGAPAGGRAGPRRAFMPRAGGRRMAAAGYGAGRGNRGSPSGRAGQRRTGRQVASGAAHGNPSRATCACRAGPTRSTCCSGRRRLFPAISTRTRRPWIASRKCSDRAGSC